RTRRPAPGRSSCHGRAASRPCRLLPSRAPWRGAPRDRPRALACWAWLLSRPLRRALLEEGGQAFARVVGRKALREAIAQHRQGTLEIEIVLCREGPQAETHRARRPGSDAVGDPLPLRVELGGGDDPVHEPQSRGLPRVELLA